MQEAAQILLCQNARRKFISKEILEESPFRAKLGEIIRLFVSATAGFLLTQLIAAASTNLIYERGNAPAAYSRLPWGITTDKCQSVC